MFDNLIPRTSGVFFLKLGSIGPICDLFNVPFFSITVSMLDLPGMNFKLFNFFTSQSLSHEYLFLKVNKNSMKINTSRYQCKHDRSKDPRRKSCARTLRVVTTA